MDIVTFETAVKLKEAGFPQPDFKTGQQWYNQSGDLTFVGRREVSVDGSYEFFHCHSVLIGRTDAFTPIKDGAFYAPTVTDILPKLEHPDPTVDFFLFWSDGLFSVIRAYWMDASGNIGEHANAAEALALAWLELKKEQV